MCVCVCVCVCVCNTQLVSTPTTTILLPIVDTLNELNCFGHVIYKPQVST